MIQIRLDIYDDAAAHKLSEADWQLLEQNLRVATTIAGLRVKNVDIDRRKAREIREQETPWLNRHAYIAPTRQSEDKQP